MKRAPKKGTERRHGLRLSMTSGIASLLLSAGSGQADPASSAPPPPPRGSANLDKLAPLISRLDGGVPGTRIVALGSSNTERGQKIGNVQNWVDWLDTGLKRWYGRCHIVINAGVSGHTSGQCLERFDRDVALFQPHAVFVTVGGNDANPEKGVSPETFRSNLTAIVARVRAIPDCVPILQTYYGLDLDAIRESGKAQYARNLPAYMQIVREVARDTGATLIDHDARWERLKQADFSLYKRQMFDSLHLNGLGNTVFAWDILRVLKAEPKDDLVAVCEEALAIRRRLDELEAAR